MNGPQFRYLPARVQDCLFYAYQEENCYDLQDPYYFKSLAESAWYSVSCVLWKFNHDWDQQGHSDDQSVFIVLMVSGGQELQSWHGSSIMLHFLK